MINLNNLRVFYMVAKNESVFLAAEELFISQPAVSNALKKIQKDTKLELFKKNGRQLVLTEKGKQLHALAKKLYEAEKEIDIFLNQDAYEKVDTIHIGIATLYERFGMIEIMEAFEGSDSSITVSVESGNSRRLIKQLYDKKIDMCITGDLIQEENNLIINHYRRHEVYLVIPKGHKLFGKKQFSPEDILNENMVYKEQGSSVRKAVDSYFQKHNIKGKAIAELSNLDSTISVCTYENCLCFIPDMALDSMLIGNNNFSFALPKSDSITFDISVVTREKGDYSNEVWEKINYFLSNIKKTNELEFFLYQ